jgi:predicted NACHT family NTPase
MDSDDFHFKFKIALLGDSGSGKSYFLDRLAEKRAKRTRHSAADECSNQTLPEHLRLPQPLPNRSD